MRRLVQPDGWYPASWRRRPARQMPAYADEDAVRAVEARLAQARRRSSRSTTRRGCATRWPSWRAAAASCFRAAIAPRASTIRSPSRSPGSSACSTRWRSGSRRSSGGPLVEVARIAGQFAKPRSAEIETHDGLTPARLSRRHRQRRRVRRGRARTADPQRMIRAHMQSVGTAASLAAARGRGAPIFTSHEALLLPYEEAADPPRCGGALVGDDRAICCGSATARGSSTARMSNICAGSKMSSA